MARAPRHLLPAALPLRLPLAALLAAWLLALLAPLLHVHVGHHADDGTDHDAAHCEQPFLPHGAEPAFAASCPDGGSCREPGHHHHSHETRVHGAAGCQQCASFWERRIEPPLPFVLAPLVVERCAPVAVRMSPQAQRAVFAWARGPPALDGSSRRCALSIA